MKTNVWISKQQLFSGGDGLKEKRTLCKSCAGDYRTAGFRTVPDGFQVIKSSCDLCGRPGYDYVIKKQYEKGAG